LSKSRLVNTIASMKRQTDPDVRLLQGAADPTRLAILRQLTAEGSVCACEFTDCCDVGQPTVSHHLRVLRESGWVRAERRASWVYYSIEPKALARFRELAGGLEAGGGSPFVPSAATATKAATSRRLPVVQPS
jgi:DNA-binding transcriptional ArsR family regulator